MLTTLTATSLIGRFRAPQSAGYGPNPAGSDRPAGGSVYCLPGRLTLAGPARSVVAAAPDAADFVLDKSVMTRAEWNQTQSCDTSVESLSVYYGTQIAYCYLFYNIGDTSFITHTFDDDKMGSLGAFVQTLPAGSQAGFVALPPDGFTQDVTNTATWTAIDRERGQCEARRQAHREGGASR